MLAASRFAERLSRFRAAVGSSQRVLFAHSRKAKVHFLLVMSRAAAAIVVLSILLTGICSPAACCGVLCSSGHRTEAEHAPNKVSQPMVKMAHHHSGPEKHSITAATELLLAESCRSNCSVAETASSSSKFLLQETSSQNRSAGPQPATKLLADNCGTMPAPGPTPPEPPGTYGLSFSVLRI